MTSHSVQDTTEVGYDELCGMLMAKDLTPLWKQVQRLNTPTPTPTTKAWLWKWESVLALAERAGVEVTIDRGGDRRVLALTNPGLGGMPFSTSTLWGAVQYLGPYESAPAHRHTASAIRFVMQGAGTYTTVDGDALDMEPGDLILTPNWHWHDHTNTTGQAMAWFDGLDLPLVTSLDAVFFEQHPDLMQEVKGRNLSESRFGEVGTRGADEEHSRPFSPLLRYPWERTSRTLDALTAGARDSWVRMRYVNPVTGGHVLPTMACEAHRILPGQRSETRRKVGSSVYVVYRGTGSVVINGEDFEWAPGDIFVTPSWASVDFTADELAELFAISDRPVLDATGLYREETSSQQPIVSSFVPR